MDNWSTNPSRGCRATMSASHRRASWPSTNGSRICAEMSRIADASRKSPVVLIRAMASSGVMNTPSRFDADVPTMAAAMLPRAIEVLIDDCTVLGSRQTHNRVRGRPLLAEHRTRQRTHGKPDQREDQEAEAEDGAVQSPMPQAGQRLGGLEPYAVEEEDTPIRILTSSRRPPPPHRGLAGWWRRWPPTRSPARSGPGGATTVWGRRSPRPTPYDLDGIPQALA